MSGQLASTSKWQADVSPVGSDDVRSQVSSVVADSESTLTCKSKSDPVNATLTIVGVVLTFFFQQMILMGTLSCWVLVLSPCFRGYKHRLLRFASWGSVEPKSDLENMTQKCLGRWIKCSNLHFHQLNVNKTRMQSCANNLFTSNGLFKFSSAHLVNCPFTT